MVTIQSLEGAVSSQVPIERRVKDLKFALSLSRLLAIVFYCRAGRLKEELSDYMVKNYLIFLNANLVIFSIPPE